MQEVLLMVAGISLSLLQNYATYVNKASVSTEKMFEKLSKDLGGDGSSINKDDLNKYIEDAENNAISVNDTKLTALKTLQKSWDAVSNGEGSISFSNMKDYTNLLGLAYTSDIISSINSSTTSDTNYYNSLVEQALGGKSSTSVTSSTTASKSDLVSQLKSLLSENSDENDNSDEIDSVINLLAKLEGVTQTSGYAVSKSLASSINYQV